MAVSGVSSSTSIYGNRNVITGLASGMDTESMIENAISAYKNKITSLTQQRTKTEWRQEAYRSIIDKMASFTDKYTSYRSSNNLMSASFFNSAVKTVTKGTYADKITATGRANSDIQVNRVKQLATAATYKISGTALDAGTSDFNSSSVSASAGGSFKLDDKIDVNAFSGNMTLAYGGSNALSYLTVTFDDTKTYKNAQELADEINSQLKGQTITIGNSSYTGDELLEKVIKAEAKADGSISFADPKKNNVYISNASDSIKTNLLGMSKSDSLSSVADKQVKTLSAKNVASMKTTMSTLDYLDSTGANMQITLDGATKSVKMPSKSELYEKMGMNTEEGIKFMERVRSGSLTDAEKEKLDTAYVQVFQDKIDSAFGAGKMKVEDINKAAGEDGGLQFQFTTTQKGSTFSVSSAKGETMGMGKSEQVTSYLNTSKTLGELMQGKNFRLFEAAYETDSKGNKTNELATDANGKQLYSFKVNGKEIGQFNEDSKLSDVLNAINNSDEVKVNYSKLTNELTFTAKETGANSKVEFSGMSEELFNSNVEKLDSNFNASYGLHLRDGESASMTIHLPGDDIGFDVTNKMTTEDIAKEINKLWQSGQYTASVNKITGELEILNKTGGGKIDFSMDYKIGANGKMRDVAMPKVETSYTPGQDAILDVTINGTKLENFTRSSNTVELDGLSMTLKGTFETKADEEPVSFETSSDADKIVAAVKEMINDYNAMATEIKNAYSTLPAQRSNGAYYEPLTDEEEEDMSESAIKNWTEKAKAGILFGDSDLSNLYRRLTSAISINGEHGATLRAAGVTVKYSNGLSTLEFDEDKFRAALEKDPDKVRDAFISSTETGAKSNGLMQSLNKPLEMYGKTSGGKGILVNKAGSPLAASTMYSNTIQKELDRIDEQISKWQDKMSDQVDRYTSQFSRLEQLIQQMNSQSSYFSQLMGG